jgi:hypothetical protein
VTARALGSMAETAGAENRIAILRFGAVGARRLNWEVLLVTRGLRSGAMRPTAKMARGSNLHAFTVTDTKVDHGTQGSDLSEAISDLARAAEKIGADQKQLGKWMGDLRSLAEEARGVRKPAPGRAELDQALASGAELVDDD